MTDLQTDYLSVTSLQCNNYPNKSNNIYSVYITGLL